MEDDRSLRAILGLVKTLLSVRSSAATTKCLQKSTFQRTSIFFCRQISTPFHCSHLIRQHYAQSFQELRAGSPLVSLSHTHE